jgi:hypothetical protein
MKKVFIVAALAIVSFANAQKGTVLVAGNVGYSSFKQGDYKESSFEFSPKVGYQFTDNVTLGLETAVVNATYMREVGSNVAEYEENGFKLGAFLRYSQPLAGVFSVFGDFGIGMQSAKTSNNIPFSKERKSDGFYMGVVPAIGVNLKKGFCLNFSIGGLAYDSMKEDFNGAESANTFAFTFGKQASIGISKNF